MTGAVQFLHSSLMYYCFFIKKVIQCNNKYLHTIVSLFKKYVFIQKGVLTNMFTLLSRLFIPDWNHTASPAVRKHYGILCGSLGIFFNLLLFTGKFLAGLFSGSIAITADAFNNLSDAGSSVITLIGFQMAGQKPDPDHPFGHGRIEYLSGLLVSVIILFMAFELVTGSVKKILSPEPVSFSLLTVCILIASILIKLYMTMYNRSIGIRIDSLTLQASAADSLSDVLSTSAVLLSLLAGHWTALPLDGICGILVGLFIFYTGFHTARETITSLLGRAPDAAFVEQIRELVLCHKEVSGIHDIIVHDYGPGRVMISLHAEVPDSGDLVSLHQSIDHIEQRLREELGCEAVIHMDPVVTTDRHTLELREQVAHLLSSAYPEVCFHDFRLVKTADSTNILFDVVIPFRYSASDEEVMAYLRDGLHNINPDFRPVMQVDRDFGTHASQR